MVAGTSAVCLNTAESTILFVPASCFKTRAPNVSLYRNWFVAIPTENAAKAASHNSSRVPSPAARSPTATALVVEPKFAQLSQSISPDSARSLVTVKSPSIVQTLVGLGSMVIPPEPVMVLPLMVMVSPGLPRGLKSARRRRYRLLTSRSDGRTTDPHTAPVDRPSESRVP